jgi:hypothetical protein
MSPEAREMIRSLQLLLDKLQTLDELAPSIAGLEELADKVDDYLGDFLQVLLL